MRMIPLLAALCAACFAMPAEAAEPVAVPACHPTRAESLIEAHKAAEAAHGHVIEGDQATAQSVIDKMAGESHGDTFPVTGMIVVEFTHSGQTDDIVGMIRTDGCMSNLVGMPASELARFMGPSA